MEGSKWLPKGTSGKRRYRSQVFRGLNAAILMRRTMDLGFLVANTKGQRECEDGSSEETVEVRVETRH